MTRPRADDYDDKKHAILAQAAALFAQHGFGRTTMSAVAAACGTSKSHLYHYVARKEDLLFAIVKDHITTQAAELTNIVALPLPAEARFERFIACFVARSADSRHEHLVLMNALQHLPEPQRLEVHQLETQLVDLMVSLLLEINPGLMKPSAVRTPYALLLYGMVIWTFTWYQKSGAIGPQELAARIAQLLLNGFKGAQGTDEATGID